MAQKSSSLRWLLKTPGSPDLDLCSFVLIRGQNGFGDGSASVSAVRLQTSCAVSAGRRRARNGRGRFAGPYVNIEKLQFVKFAVGAQPGQQVVMGAGIGDSPLL